MVCDANNPASMRILKHLEINDDNLYVRQRSTKTYDSGEKTLDAHRNTIL